MNDLEPIGDLQHPVVRKETCSLAAVRRIAAMLNQDPDKWSEGDLLPRGWQFILLGADTKRSELREDGFPGLGVSLPDLGLPRLMLGGRTMHYYGDIRIGAVLRRESQIQKLTRKETANGPMAFVTVAHALHAPGRPDPILVETQNYILLGSRPAGRKATDSASVVMPPGAAKRIVPDETLLFQYSALGFNSHKIHLDRNFARETEGFPDLVVNGGLATLLLTEFLRLELTGAFTSLSAKHVAPLFCDRPISLWGERQDDAWLLRAFDDNGVLAVDIEARL
jgi:3-methylfumaryl-CoA hydratase